MSYVIWENAITWVCPGCQTRYFQEGEPFDLDDETECEIHRLHCEAILEDINHEQAEASADLPPISFAQAEARGAFDDLRRPPFVVACEKCKVKYDCLSPDEVEHIDTSN